MLVWHNALFANSFHLTYHCPALPKKGLLRWVDLVVKRYGVLHPYPLPSLWRSSPGQIRNFPVDATAS